MKKKEIKPIPIYNLASGKPGKKFTVKQFLEFTNNVVERPFGPNTDKKIKIDDKYTYFADSKQEVQIVNKLKSTNSYKKLRGQCLSIPYKYGGKQKTYIPDLVLLTKSNKIVIIEIKELSEMSSRVNQKKYRALKNYCARYGYLYLMCDKRFNTFEKLNKSTRMPTIEEAIKKAIKKKGRFDYEDYKLLIKGKKILTVKHYRDAIGYYSSKHKAKIKMVGNLTHDIKRFMLIKKANATK